MCGSDYSGGFGYSLGVGGSGDAAGSSLVCLHNNARWCGNAYTLTGLTTYHVVVTYGPANSGTLLWYVNGSLVATQTGIPAPGPPNGAHNYASSIGCDPGGGSTTRNFGGTIQAAAIYPVTLTAGQVTNHYNAFTGTTTVSGTANVTASASCGCGGVVTALGAAMVQVRASVSVLGITTGTFPALLSVGFGPLAAIVITTTQATGLLVTTTQATELV